LVEVGKLEALTKLDTWPPTLEDLATAFQGSGGSGTGVTVLQRRRPGVELGQGLELAHLHAAERVHLHGPVGLHEQVGPELDVHAHHALAVVVELPADLLDRQVGRVLDVELHDAVFEEDLVDLPAQPLGLAHGVQSATTAEACARGGDHHFAVAAHVVTRAAPAAAGADLDALLALLDLGGLERAHAGDPNRPPLLAAGELAQLGVPARGAGPYAELGEAR
jgi:hypothetical protein